MYITALVATRKKCIASLQNIHTPYGDSKQERVTEKTIYTIENIHEYPPVLIHLARDGTLCPKEYGTLYPKKDMTLCHEDATLYPKEDGTLCPRVHGTFCPKD